MKLLIALAFVCQLFTPSFASTPQEIQEAKKFLNANFTFIKEEGKIIQVRDKWANRREFSLVPWLKFFVELARSEQSLGLTGEGTAEREALLDEMMNESLLNGDFKRKTKKQKYRQRVSKGLQEALNVNFAELENSKGLDKFLVEFEKKWKKWAQKLALNVVADLDDPRFFYRRKVAWQVSRWGRTLAFKFIKAPAALNFALFMVDRSVTSLRQTRQFHQNMLIHLIGKYKPSDLGITEDDRAKIFSSIYESRLAWYQFLESGKAKRNWHYFGAYKYSREFRSAEETLERVSPLYRALGEKYNYAFQEVLPEGERLVINLLDSTSSFNKKPALAYDHNRPRKVARFRALMQLAEFGVGFLPLPGFITDNMTSFIRSHYLPQSIREGSLYSYLSIAGHTKDAKDLSRQGLNPFEPLAF